MPNSQLMLTVLKGALMRQLGWRRIPETPPARTSSSGTRWRAGRHEMSCRDHGLGEDIPELRLKQGGCSRHGSAPPSATATVNRGLARAHRGSRGGLVDRTLGPRMNTFSSTCRSCDQVF